MDSNNTAGSNVATRVSADTIPKEIMAVLPTDPNEQLEMSHRIANLAFSQKIKALERRVTNLELEVNDAQEKARHSMEEQTKLVGEKNALIGTVKKLNRDLAKLDSFKRNLLQSLQDEDETVPGGATMTPARDLSSDRLVNSGSDGSPRVDGKEFFRQARSRLAYEQFSQFLQNIKELNAHRQTREETLKKAQEIFGSEN
eukprot:gene19196-22947_t